MALFGRKAAETPQPAEPVRATEGLEKHRVHHSYIWLGGLYVTFIVLFSASISLGSSLVPMIMFDGDPFGFVVIAICALSILLVIAAVFAYRFVAYKHVWYEIGPSEFSFYQGILSKKRVHIPYQRIQSVDQRASLIQRIFGVCTVSVDTAGGSANKATVIPYIVKQDAEVLRRELFARKRYALAVEAGTVSQEEVAKAFSQQAAGVADSSGNVLDAPAGLWDDLGGVFAGDAVDTGAVSYEYGLSNKELILTGLSNNTAFALILVGVLGIIGQLIDLIFGFAPATVGTVDQLVAEGSTWVVGAAAAAGIAFLFGTVVFIWALSAVATCLSYGGFKARRRGSRIEVERGLLQHQFNGVDVDRVQSITIRQSLVRRALGCCEVSIGKVEASANGDDGSQQNNAGRGLVIHPFVKMSRVPEILAGIIPEYADVPYEALPLPRVALRRGIIRRCILQGFGFWLAVLTALTQISVNVVAGTTGDPELVASLGFINAAALVGYAFAVVLLVVDVIGAVLWYRESSFAFNRGFMQITRGGLARESTSFPRSKIQFGYTRVNPFQHRAGTRTICVRTAAGIGGSTIRLIDASEPDALAWLAWLRPRGNVVS